MTGYECPDSHSPEGVCALKPSLCTQGKGSLLELVSPGLDFTQPPVTSELEREKKLKESCWHALMFSHTLLCCLFTAGPPLLLFALSLAWRLPGGFSLLMEALLSSVSNY